MPSMPNVHSQFLREMDQRDLIHQCSDAAKLDALLADRASRAYIGFDCTAPSLHVGNLLAIMTLRRWQQAGHQPIILVGGGTTLIGDPSGKDTQRSILAKSEIEKNTAALRKTFSRFISFGDAPSDAILVNNYDWLKDLNYIEFLRDVGQHFSVNRMLTMDSVKLRLAREQPLSFIEFNYMIVQAYDFLHLRQNFGCRVQMGGSDQWGNIINGVELARRAVNAELFALTTPLITTSSGAKMGKTAKGAVWLNAEPTGEKYFCSHHDYWQFWRNTQDQDVGLFLRAFTELPMGEISRLEKLPGEEINEAKKILADHATTLAHGQNAAQTASQTAKKVFEQKTISQDMPSTEIKPEQLAQGLGLLEAYVLAGLAASNSEARRAIRGGGAYVNNVLVKDENKKLAMSDLIKSDLTKDQVIILSIGKKRHQLLRLK